MRHAFNCFHKKRTITFVFDILQRGEICSNREHHRSRFRQTKEGLAFNAEIGSVDINSSWFIRKLMASLGVEVVAISSEKVGPINLQAPLNLGLVKVFNVFNTINLHSYDR